MYGRDLRTSPTDELEVIREALSPGPLPPPDPLFASRGDAGRKLASVLCGSDHDQPAVVGIARGGVIVAAAVAAALGAPLEVVAVERIEHPGRPGYAVGAITADSRVYLRANGELTPPEITAAVTRARHVVELFERRLRAKVEPLELDGRQVFIVDDGIATGCTMTAAVRSIRARGANQIVVAAPVASIEGLTRVLHDVTETACLHVVHDFGALSEWYRSFPDVPDDAVLDSLEVSGFAVCSSARTSSRP